MSELGNAGNVTNSAPVINFIIQPDVPDKPARAKLPAANRAAAPVKTIAATPMSCDNRVENFARRATPPAAKPNYAPNERDSQTARLNNTLADLRRKNTAVSNAANQLPNARLARNQTLYHDTNSLVKTALYSKRYLKSVFGATSPQFRQINGLKFTKQSI